MRLRGDGSAEVFEGEGDALVWDAHHPEASPAFALSRLTRDTVGATPIGVFRDIERPVYRYVANWGRPDTDLTSENYGRITTLNDQFPLRTVVFGGRLTY